LISSLLSGGEPQFDVHRPQISHQGNLLNCFDGVKKAKDRLLDKELRARKKKNRICFSFSLVAAGGCLAMGTVLAVVVVCQAETIIFLFSTYNSISMSTALVVLLNDNVHLR